MQETKLCRRCEVIKSIDAFGIQNKKNGRKRLDCRQCSAEISRIFRAKQSNNYATRPGTHEDLGDAIYHVNGFLNRVAPYNKMRGERSSMPFEGGRFDPDRARLRAAGSI